jgi:glucan biosynthesis protein
MKKEHAPSLAQKLFSNKEILTKRPANMTFEEYKTIRYAQTQALRLIIRRKSDVKIAQMMPVRFGYNKHTI